MNKIFNFIKDNKFLVAILIVAAALRFYKINFQSLWMDEIYTMNVSNPANSYATVITEVNNREGFPYFYFLLLKTLYFIFGYSPFVSRGLSAIFGVLSVYMIAKLGEKMYNKQAGIFAALLLAFSEYAIYISQDARPYTFYLFAVLLTYYLLIQYFKEVSKINAIKYGLALGLLLNVNFFAAINVMSQGVLLVLFYFIIDTENRKNYIKNTLLTIIITFVLFSPNIYKLLLLSKIESFWIPAPTPETISLIVKEFLGNSEIRLPFPPDAIKVKEKALSWGLDEQVTKIETTLNRAAEEATKEALPIFKDAILNMSIQDGFAILNGGNGAATKYLKTNTKEKLAVAFGPKVQAAIEKVKLTDYWNPVATKYNQAMAISGGQKVETDLNKYVTDRAIEGLFLMVEKEENKIRLDPAARVTDLLSKVFGSIGK